ncbi:MAG: hypothetical protein JWM82_2508 [Myxococcales bacterium]|nr:hypothetical protein [Myxococcales bacterium]
MSGLPKSPISWEITGGIATKNAPIMLQPGSNLVLDNVRQERKNEWRTRPGNTRDVADDLPGGNVPVIATEATWGGLVGLCRQTDSATAGRVYSRDLSLTGATSRWMSPANNASTAQQACAQSTPGMWMRSPVGQMVGNPAAWSIAEGGGLRLSAWWSRFSNAGVQVVLSSLDGEVRLFSTNIGVSTNVRPQCVYCPTANTLSVFYIDPSALAGFVTVTTFNCATGASLGENTFATNAFLGDGSGSYLSAICYGNSATITVVYRNAGSTLQFVEYNPATGATAANVNTGLNCSLNAQLLPDPDNAGATARYVSLTSVAPSVSVSRFSSTGALLSTDAVEAVDAQNVAGCAYQSQSGTPGWMLVYGALSTGLLHVAKKRNGTISAPFNLLPAGNQVAYGLVSNGWREPGTDTMRYVLGMFGTAADQQRSFYEMAVEWENGSPQILNYWNEPQARLVPLNAGSGFEERGCVPQVQRTGTDTFVLCEPRVVRLSLPANGTSADATQYMLDRWGVQYMGPTTYTGKNQGAGCKTQQCAYLPVGSLLQTATGQQLVAHGAGALPFAPTLTPGNFAGTALNFQQQYSYVVTTEFQDEAGNLWSSQPSNPVRATLVGAGPGGQNQFSVNIQHFPFENQQRNRTVKLWRTVGNGSQYFLLYQTTGTIAATDVITFVDNTEDRFLTEPISGEQQATVTPAFIHVVAFNRRLWGVERDFPSRIRFSKPFGDGTSPMFPADFYINVDDEHGDLTKLEAMDDRIIATKGAATYIVSGDGPDNLGNGSYPSVVRISSETGCIPGGPSLSTGADVYLTSAGGVWRVNRGQAFDFVGAAIDQYLSMPLVTSPETVTGIVLSPAKNEVRVQTTHYRFVHDRIFDLWERDTGGFLAGTVVMTKKLGENTQCFFTSTGQLWIEGADVNAPNDAGTAYQGLIRSPWVRASGVGGWLRLYKARLEGTITATATVTGAELRLFFNEDDNVTEAWAPTVNLSAATGIFKAEARPKRQRCSSFSIQLKFPTNDATVRLSEWWALVAPKAGGPPSLLSERWV